MKTMSTEAQAKMEECIDGSAITFKAALECPDIAPSECIPVIARACFSAGYEFSRYEERVFIYKELLVKLYSFISVMEQEGHLTGYVRNLQEIRDHINLFVMEKYLKENKP